MPWPWPCPTCRPRPCQCAAREPIKGKCLPCAVALSVALSVAHAVACCRGLFPKMAYVSVFDIVIWPTLTTLPIMCCSCQFYVIQAGFRKITGGFVYQYTHIFPLTCSKSLQGRARPFRRPAHSVVYPWQVQRPSQGHTGGHRGNSSVQCSAVAQQGT